MFCFVVFVECVVTDFDGCIPILSPCDPSVGRQEHSDTHAEF